VHLAEAFNVDCEIHGGGTANLAVLGGSRCGQWYERGLVHPLVDYDEVPPHLTALPDPLDGNGRVAMPDQPGLGDPLDLDYIGAHEVAAW
jgi:L-alanine-DL-glutamate epimerase-like enolase superfamily enzyme